MKCLATSFVIALAGVLHGQTQPPQTQPKERELTVEQEVRGNILNQRIGDHSVADLNLPRPLVDRIADRIIRSSYEQRYRIVVDDIAPATQTQALRGDSAGHNRLQLLLLCVGVATAGGVIALARKLRRGVKR